ncbi:hypothetical protein Tco_0865663 [Tanacetum coccineum]
MTRSNIKELFSPFENPEQKFRSRRRLFDTPSLVESNSTKFDHISDIEEQSGEEGQFLKELRDNTFNSSEHEDANEHIEMVLEIVVLFHIPKITQDQIMLRAFPVSLTGVASRWLRNQPSGSITTWEKWHNGTSSRTRSTETSDGLAAIQAQLNSLGREIKKVNEKVYAARVGCELCKGLQYTKDYPQKEEGKTLEEAYYTQFGAPYQPEGQYRAAGPGFYQRNNRNSSYPNQRPSLEESLTKFMAELAKRHEENSNIIKEIRASTDAAIRNQGASIKTLEIQIGQMSKVLQERGFGSLPSSTKTNPRDQVKSISTAKANFSEIRRIGCGPYAVSRTQHMSIFSETVPFPRRLQNFSCDDWKEAQDVKILDTYDHTLPQKEKDTGSFTLPCFIHNIYFDKALVDLGASVSVMPFSTYINLSLGILSHARLTIELADRTIKQPRGIAENVLVRISKFIFPIDFIILDIPEDDDDKDEGKSHAETLIDIPVFVGSFSIITGFTTIDSDDITKDVVLGMKFSLGGNIHDLDSIWEETEQDCNFTRSGFKNRHIVLGDGVTIPGDAVRMYKRRRQETCDGVRM